MEKTDAATQKHDVYDQIAGAAVESDIRGLRGRARANLSDGAVTEDYKLDPQAVVRMLDEALATEIVCMLRYRRHYFMAEGIKARVAADEFLEHSRQELEHVDLLAKRIVELGGEPDFDPGTLVGRSHAEYVGGQDLREMIEEDLVAERIAIESYRSIIRSLNDSDSTTRRVIEAILAVEEEHADDMRSLLKGFGER